MLAAVMAGPIAFSSAKAEDSLVFQVEHHPPFLEIEAGRVSGIFGDTVNQAAAIAGLTIEWQERAFNRIKRNLDDGTQPFCVAGYWKKSTEQDEQWHFSPPIGTFGRSGLLVREADKAAFEALPSIEALFTDTDFIGGFVTDAVYAIPHLELLKKSHNKHLFIASSHDKLAELLARKRIDFVIENELMAPIHKAQVAGGDALAFLSLEGMPAGREAHVVCTKAVPTAILSRLDAGLEVVKKAAQE
ncbi:transporter substrate-binding domain-containing protein [Kordiimonas lipolytica]|uniref:transporter substrate-binding domain-containing protein n=1 Tax=Kordiimonas lipolytica TaxID=1662421 RepID=UPI00082E4AFA|nr:transporter substrate-binding domain-containing protein [Kordiimonas lipolytica]